MNITARAKDFEVTSAIDQFVRDQIRTALRHVSEDIMAVDVFMKDANGPKGGVDKHALFRVQLRNRQVLAIETVHENLYAAIKKGAKRTRRTVHRHLQKSRRIHKQQTHDGVDHSGIATAT